MSFIFYIYYIQFYFLIHYDYLGEKDQQKIRLLNISINHEYNFKRKYYKGNVKAYQA